MKYKYKILSDGSKLESGIVEAPSEKSALRLLMSQGHVVVDLLPFKSAVAGDPSKVKTAAVLQLFDELITLLRSGVTLVDAVESLAEAQSNISLQIALAEISKGLQQGQSFSQVLSDSKLRLPEYLLQLTSAGELTGRMADALHEGAEQMRFDEQLLSETKNALIYPAILVITGIAAVGLVFALVVPKFSNLLDGKVELPFLAEAVLRSGLFFNENGMLLLAGFFTVGFSLAAVFRKPEVRSRMLDSMSRWPVVGGWLVESETGRWTAILGALLGNGVDLMDGLALANDGVRIPSRKKKLEKAAQAVRGGESLSEALRVQDALLPTAYNILQVGERAGELPAMLKSLSALYEKSGKNRMKQMLILIEPIAILLIGGAIGTIILGVILAITSASDIPL